jgi:hypothetical protein
MKIIVERPDLRRLSLSWPNDTDLSSNGAVLNVFGLVPGDDFACKKLAGGEARWFRRLDTIFVHARQMQTHVE